jgi:membrane fusion protein, multidrug efflux system
MRAIFILTLLAAASFSGCGKREAAAPVRAAGVSAITAPVLTVASEPFQMTVPVTGSLISRARVDVKAEVIGRVVRFDKEEGAHVEAGEAVAWVNDENYRLALRQAETAVVVAEAGLERAKLVASHSRSELERAENLVKSGGITDKDLKTARLADRDAAAQVAIAEAQIEQARAARDLANKHIRDTVIRAPVSGEIQRKAVTTGAYVEAPTLVMTIVDNGRLELECAVPSADLGAIHPGQRVPFTVNSYPGATFEGRVVEINPAVDELTRSAKVRVRAENAGRKLKAGMFAQGQILTGASVAAIVVPASSVYRDDRAAKSAYVFVVQDGKAARRDVRIGRERDSKLEVAEGLQPGDRLITEPSIEIADGVAVTPRS